MKTGPRTSKYGALGIVVNCLSGGEVFHQGIFFKSQERLPIRSEPGDLLFFFLKKKGHWIHAGPLGVAMFEIIPNSQGANVLGGQFDKTDLSSVWLRKRMRFTIQASVATPYISPPFDSKSAPAKKGLPFGAVLGGSQTASSPVIYGH